MMTIDREECIECRFCESICHKGAVTPHEDYAFEITESCVKCSVCANNCPVNAIS